MSLKINAFTIVSHPACFLINVIHKTVLTFAVLPAAFDVFKSSAITNFTQQTRAQKKRLNIGMKLRADLGVPGTLQPSQYLVPYCQVNHFSADGFDYFVAKTMMKKVVDSVFIDTIRIQYD